MSRRLNRHLNSKSKLFTSVWFGVIPISPFKPILVRIISYPLSDPVHQKLSIWLNFGSAPNLGDQKIIPYFMASWICLFWDLTHTDTYWYPSLVWGCFLVFLRFYIVTSQQNWVKYWKHFELFNDRIKPHWSILMIKGHLGHFTRLCQVQIIRYESVSLLSNTRFLIGGSN